MGQEVRTALDSPALNAEAKAKLKEEWASFKAVREFHRPWDSLSYKHQHTEADLLKKQLMKAELKKRRDQGQVSSSPPLHLFALVLTISRAGDRLYHRQPPSPLRIPRQSAFSSSQGLNGRRNRSRCCRREETGRRRQGQARYDQRVGGQETTAAEGQGAGEGTLATTSRRDRTFPAFPLFLHLAYDSASTRTGATSRRSLVQHWSRGTEGPAEPFRPCTVASYAAAAE